MTSSDPHNLSSRSGSQGGSGNRGMRRIMRVALALVAVAAIGTLALYGKNAGSGNAPGLQNANTSSVQDEQGDQGGRCAGSVAQASALAPFIKGEMKSLVLVSAPRPLPPLVFTGPDGTELTPADFRSKVVLVNLWATWCAPCRKEMPALNALQEELGGPAFEVVAVNIDAKDTVRPRAFLENVHADKLELYVDSQSRSFQALRSVGRGFGLPSTLLLNGEGCELGFLAGPAEWDGPDALALIRAAIAQTVP